MKKMIDLAGEIPALERTGEGKLCGGFSAFSGLSSERGFVGLGCKVENNVPQCGCPSSSTEGKTTESTTKAEGASLCLGGSALF